MCIFGNFGIARLLFVVTMLSVRTTIVVVAKSVNTGKFQICRFSIVVKAMNCGMSIVRLSMVVIMLVIAASTLANAFQCYVVKGDCNGQIGNATDCVQGFEECIKFVVSNTTGEHCTPFYRRVRRNRL